MTFGTGIRISAMSRFSGTLSNGGGAFSYTVPSGKIASVRFVSRVTSGGSPNAISTFLDSLQTQDSSITGISTFFEHLPEGSVFSASVSGGSGTFAYRAFIVEFENSST